MLDKEMVIIDFLYINICLHFPLPTLIALRGVHYCPELLSTAFIIQSMGRNAMKGCIWFISRNEMGIVYGF